MPQVQISKVLLFIYGRRKEYQPCGRDPMKNLKRVVDILLTNDTRAAKEISAFADEKVGIKVIMTDGA